MSSDIRRAARNFSRLLIWNPGLHMLGRWLLKWSYSAPTTELNLQNARRILIVKPDEIGDFVLASGFLRSLRVQCPQAQLFGVFRHPAYELAEDSGLFSGLELYQSTWQVYSSRPSGAFELALASWRRWHRQPPDLAIIPRTGGDFYRAAHYAWWSGARTVVAFDRLCEEFPPGASRLASKIVQADYAGHELENLSRMLRGLGIDNSDISPAIKLQPSLISETRAALSTRAIVSTWIAFGIGSSAASKRWPNQNFAALARHILSTMPKAGVVVVGGKEDFEDGQVIAAECPNRILNAAGHYTVSGSAALMSYCAAFVGNDSGPMHIAAALGLPVIAIFKHPAGADTASCYAPERFGPIAAHRVVLQPTPSAPECRMGCLATQAHCIATIGVPTVARALSEILKTAGAGSMVPASNSIISE